MKKIIVLCLIICFISILASCDLFKHEHIVDEQWSYDEEYHWKNIICSQDRCMIEPATFEHEDADDNNICDVCGYVFNINVSSSVQNIAFAIEDKTNELVKYKTSILANLKASIAFVPITSLFDDCIDKLKNAASICEVNELADKCLEDVYKLIPTFNGVFDAFSFEEVDKQQILPLLDDYIFRNNLGGIPISQYYTLNLNSTSKGQWNEFFGEEGSVCQTPKNEYWNVKPFLSNEYFLKGLCLAIPKDDSLDEVSDCYKTDYSKYEFYNYDLELARKYFSVAMEELAPIYSVSSQYPIQLELEIAFGTKTAENEALFNTLKNNIESAFNDLSVSNGEFVLTVKPWYGEYFGQIYTEKNYNGQFDLSYDKISGSSYDEYMYYNLLSSNSDFSNGLTINWSIDTNSIEDDCIVFNGYKFSYDASLALLSSKYTIKDGVVQTSCKVNHSYNNGVYVAPVESTPGDEGYMRYTCDVCGHEEIVILPQVFSFAITFGFDGYYNTSTGELKNGYNHDLDVECKTTLILTEEELNEIYGIFYIGYIIDNMNDIYASEDLIEPSYTIKITYSINYIEYSFNIYGASFIDLDEWQEGHDIGYAYYKVLNDYILSSEEFKNLPPNTSVYE